MTKEQESLRPEAPSTVRDPQSRLAGFVGRAAGAGLAAGFAWGACTDLMIYRNAPSMLTGALFMVVPGALVSAAWAFLLSWLPGPWARRPAVDAAGGFLLTLLLEWSVVAGLMGEQTLRMLFWSGYLIVPLSGAAAVAAAVGWASGHATAAGPGRPS